MTIQKAIAMLQDFIDFKLLAAKVMRKRAPEDSVGDLARLSAKLHDKERETLEQILKELGQESKKALKNTDHTIKDMMAKQVRIQVTKELCLKT